MDLKAFMKYTIPEDEADEMTRVIRKTIKSIRNNRQDAEEKQKDIIMLKNKIQKEIEDEEIAKAKEKKKIEEEEKAQKGLQPNLTFDDLLPPNLPSPLIPSTPEPPSPGRSSPLIPSPGRSSPLIPALGRSSPLQLKPPPPTRPGLSSGTPGPSSEPLPSYLQANVSKFEDNLTANDLINLRKSDILKNKEEQKKPSELLPEFKRDPSLIDNLLKKSDKISSRLGGKKGNNKNAAEVAKIDKELKTQDKYRKILRSSKEELRKEKIKITPKKGKGIHFPKGSSAPLRGTLSPPPLLDRLELLTGSIVAGNNSSKVKNEFSKIVHVLHKLKFFNNADVNKLLSIL